MPKVTVDGVASALRALAFISATFAAPAAAQSGADVQVKELNRGDQAYLRSVRPFADCLVEHHAAEIPKFLGDPDQSRAIGRTLVKSHPECPRPKSNNNDPTFFLQGAVLEAMIRHDFGKSVAPSSFAKVPPFVYAKDTTNKYILQDIALIMEPYDCTTRRAPMKVQHLLKTEPLSAEEAGAFSDLKPDLVACHPKGETWDLRPYFARRYLAETFFTLMKVDHRMQASAR